MTMNIFDDIKNIFSGNNKDVQNNVKSIKEKEKYDMMKIQQEILERRRDPRKMREYEEETDKRRKELAEERAVYKFQRKQEDGYDPLTDWKRLKEEGKIKIGKDLERDEGSRRLGSEGLINVRVDERMPYIDQGYVDEDADFMGKLTGLFKKKSPSDKEDK